MKIIIDFIKNNKPRDIIILVLSTLFFNSHTFNQRIRKNRNNSSISINMLICLLHILSKTKRISGFRQTKLYHKFSFGYGF